MERLQVEAFSGKVTDVALMTDGLESLALHYASRSVHEPFFHGMFRPLFDLEGSSWPTGYGGVRRHVLFRPLFDLEEIGEIKRLSALLERFLSSERVRARTDDDVSLILATCRQ
ncbi:hypothetical protein NKDENANG_00309 [Candidatus Entotheonellaceae bacterium PAL068K]